MSNHLNRRRFLAGALLTGAAAALSACSTPQASPTAAPKSASTPATAPAKPTAGAATKPAASPAAGATQAPAKTQPTINVKHGFIRGIFDGAYVLAARTAGIYDRAGINMELVTFQDDVTATRAVLAKEVLTAEISFQNPLSVIDKGQPVKIIGLSYAKVPFVYLAKSEIKELKDLDGKSSGIGAINDLNHQLQLALLRKYNLENLNINYVPIGPTPQIVQALVAGKIDAGTGLFSNEIQLRGNPDIHMLYDLSEELPDIPRFGPITNQDSIDNDSETLERFMVAHSQAWRWALENRDAVIKSAVDDLALPEAVAAASFDAPLTREGMITPTFEFPEAKFKAIQDLTLRAGLQSKEIPYDQAVESRYIKAIQEKLGPYQVPVRKPAVPAS